MQCKVVFLIALSLILRTIAVPRTEEQPVDFYSHVESNRIVGGAVAVDGSAPYMVAISTGFIFRSFMCGGSLVSERYILTAAHCIGPLYKSGSLTRSLRVTVGTNRWNRGGQYYSVARNVTHQQYQPSIVKNDIGLLMTRKKVKVSERVAPLSLSFDFVGAGVLTRAAGWGRTKYMGPISDKLLELMLKTISDEHCVKEMSRVATELNLTAPPVDYGVEICALHSIGHGMCNGDSGSALVRVDSGQQIGVVSWGLPCARGAPDVFVRLSAFRNWIKEHTLE